MKKIKELLELTQYKDKANCISRAFERNGITDETALANAPRIMGAEVCGVSIYTVVSVLNYVNENFEELMEEEE